MHSCDNGRKACAAVHISVAADGRVAFTGGGVEGMSIGEGLPNAMEIQMGLTNRTMSFLCYFRFPSCLALYDIPVQGVPTCPDQTSLAW